MNLEVTAEELALVRGIVRRWAPGCEVWAFGSRVAGPAKPYSDLDLALRGEAPLSLTQMANLTEAMSQSDLPFRVDLLDWHSLSPAFQEPISQSHVVIWSPQGDLA